MTQLYVEKCIEEYKNLFTRSNTNKEIYKESIEEKLRNKEKYNEFERFFFVQMNNAIFSGEYLVDDYIEKVKEFENLLVVEGNVTLEDDIYRSVIRICLSDLRDIIFRIQNKIKLRNEDVLVSLTTNDIKTSKEDSYKYFGFFAKFALTLLYLDHTLIDIKDYRKILIDRFNCLQVESSGLDNEDLIEIFEKLKSKCSFLLKKTFVKDKKKSLYYAVDYVVKNVDDIIKEDKYNADFSSLFDGMYLERYGNEIVATYKENFEEKKFSAIAFIILAYYYRISDAKDVDRFDKLCEQFDDYYELKRGCLCRYDKYAFMSIKNYIYNCRFSYCLDLKDYTIEKLKIDIKNIEGIQENTGFQNYHPYKKALKFLDNYLSEHNSIAESVSEDIIKLYNDIFRQYKVTYEKCIQKHFCSFQLPINESLTAKGIFFASAFSKPISPSKLKDAERDYRETKQYLKIRQRLSKREEEINKLSTQFQSFRRESFEYLGVFIAVITFLFGSVQLFGNDKITLKPILLNIVSLGIVLGMFMSLLYIVLYSKKCKICLLMLFGVVSLGILFFFSKYLV